MTPATLTALAARMRDGQTVPTMEERAQAAAILEQVAGADAGPVRWEFRWANPRGEELLEGDTSMAWKAVEPAWNQTMERACADLEAYRFEGKPCYEVRALYDLAALTAQSGEGVAMYEALQAFAPWALTEDEVTTCHSLAVLSKKHDGTDPSFTTLLSRQIHIAIGNKLTAAQARAEAVEKDAERYRWLRASAWYVGPEHFYCDEAGGMQDLDDKNITADSLNAAIDSAIGGKGA